VLELWDNVLAHELDGLHHLRMWNLGRARQTKQDVTTAGFVPLGRRDHLVGIAADADRVSHIAGGEHPLTIRDNRYAFSLNSG
jgi:hypothetical protein